MNKHDICSALDDIIVNNLLDKYHPRFRDFLQAKKHLVNLFNEYSSNERILLVATNIRDIEAVVDCVDKSKDINSFIINMLDADVRNSDIFDKIPSADVLIIVSYNAYREISHNLSVRNIRHLCLYDYFALNGLVFSYNFYSFTLQDFWERIVDEDPDWFRITNIYREIYYDKKMYKESNHHELKEIYLTKIIFNCLIARDILSAMKYIDEYLSSGYRHSNALCKAKKEIDELLGNIREALANRRKKDIIIVWIDEAGFERLNLLPKLKNLHENTITFENAFTFTPYTKPTLKTILCGKRTIEDKTYEMATINRKNSVVIDILESHNYSFAYCGHLKCFDKQYISSRSLNVASAMTEVLWQTIESLLNSERSKCIVSHEMLTTHNPYLSAEIEGDTLALPHFNHSANDLDIQIRESYKYADESFSFFSELFPDDATVIYMSDHGHCAYNNFRVILKLVNVNFNSCTREELFSLIDFPQLLKYCLDGYVGNFVQHDFVTVQDVHFYNEFYLQKLLEDLRKKPLTPFSPYEYAAYQGVVTLDEAYLKFYNGFEMYYKIRDFDKPITAERLSFLRKHCSDEFPDLFAENKFCVAKYLEKTRENYLLRMGEFESTKKRAILNLFNSFNNSSVALRTGGEAAYMLYLTLFPQCYEKIAYAIDINPNCMLRKLGVKIVSPIECSGQALGLDVIVDVSKYSVIDQNNELYNSKIIKLYEYLQEQGVFCRTEFYKFEIEPIDVPELGTLEKGEL
jgi:hypothetical protein